MSQIPPLPPQVPSGPPPIPPNSAYPPHYANATYGPLRADFYQQAARASWIAPLIVVALNFLNQSAKQPGVRPDRTAALVVGGISFVLILAGFALAIVALLGIRKRGANGVLGPAIAGLIINGLLLSGFIWTLLVLLG